MSAPLLTRTTTSTNSLPIDTAPSCAGSRSRIGFMCLPFVQSSAGDPAHHVVNAVLSAKKFSHDATSKEDDHAVAQFVNLRKVVTHQNDTDTLVLHPGHESCDLVRLC